MPTQKTSSFSTALSEQVARRLIDRARQHAARAERARDVVGGGLLGGEVGRALAGGDRRDLGGVHAALHGGRGMGVELVGGAVAGADHEDGDLLGGLGQPLHRGHRRDLIVMRLADLGLVQEDAPGPEQRAIVAHRLERGEPARDLLAVAVVQRLLSGRQVGGGDQREADHRGSLRVRR